MSHSPGPVVVRFQAAGSAVPKHARLRQAIIDAVEAGELAAGAKLAGERELSAALGLSLGTTQKALGRLMDEGFLVRRQGHGTFVGSSRQPIAASWHFRFFAPGGERELPVFASVLERRLEIEQGPWSRVLGRDPKGYVMMHRRLDVGGKFRCTSRIYLPASRFSRLLRMAEKRIVDTNLKAVLASDFAAPTLQSDGLARLAPLDAVDAHIIGVAPGSMGLTVDITGRSFGRQPITFQHLCVPPTPYALKFDFNPPHSDDAAI
ncbi:MAG: GntR family transcriptional regulator [Burkholderiaceae bacterium]